MSTKRVCLIIDDAAYVHVNVRDRFESLTHLHEEWEIVSATTVATARTWFRDHKARIAIIFLDYCMPNPPSHTTRDLARELAKEFDGPIVAISSSHNDLLLQNGCTDALDPPARPKAFTDWLERLSQASLQS